MWCAGVDVCGIVVRALGAAGCIQEKPAFPASSGMCMMQAPRLAKHSVGGCFGAGGAGSAAVAAAAAATES